MYIAEEIQKKWAPVINHPDLDEIKDPYKRQVTAVILENQERMMRESRGGMGLLAESGPTNVMGASSSTAGDGSVDIYDPVLISLVRRAMPNLVAYDVCGVQPMTGPTGLIFAMRARYATQGGDEALFNEANTSFGSANTNAANTQTGDNPADSGYMAYTGMSTANAETRGANDPQVDGDAIPEMAFSIEKVTVTAVSRALKGAYSMELAQDLKAIHGLDAETELANILSAEILAEINREVIRSIGSSAKPGAAYGTATAGTFDLDVDSNGRWSVEKFKGLMFQIEREANAIAKDTRRGKGNMIICASDVASALQMAGVLDYTPAMQTGINVDDTGNTFAGVLNGRFKVYIDPFAANQATNYMIVGYKGSSPYDAGLFYCPYVPLQMVRAIGEDNFQPRIGFKTRYGMVANPFATSAAAGAVDIDGTLGATNQNVYYRLVKVANLM
ncbi:uncharacterized protein METZ01_LOCUS41593 [marine metagenome]|jgi:hypothetical protein|uniref:Uncharacterized protein n=1 Tax=marine metagenome TaxID=408172 RepID=A0A381RCW0_9ZZZZ|tara:strand:+ start:94 stop:1431 length:1338 start_codon:yes stop_codon:yes gene_type:complete